ncbi:biotin--[acetyl-CoA-carboxylase] ligase [Candidatus Woesearchaeota archaeon]|nr:biotin--[acetyl-CoA-carboxylase] ligase [Candidatus Woesearchaeota archaeon]
MQYKIHRFKSPTSTQDKVKEFLKKGFSNIVVIADTQTRGRGRFGRKWHSGKGGLWMSILLKPANIKNIQYLTFAAAISVVKSIKKICKFDANIKWPNDVHYKDKKLCGILTENVFGKENYVIAGIGLNVNQSEFSKDIKDIASSIKIITNKKTNINKLSKIIIDEFFNIYNHQYNKNRLNNIMKEWKKYCDTIGKEVSVITKNEIIKGKAIGADEDCNLMLKSKGKSIKIVEGDLRVKY